MIKALLKLWLDTTNHIDWCMGPFAGKRGKTYAPDPFLVGQGAGRSNISGRGDQVRFWSGRPDPKAPVCWLRAPREVLEACRDVFHVGNSRRGNGAEATVDDIFTRKLPEDHMIRKLQSLVRWWLVGEAADMTLPEKKAIATVWHPAVPRDLAYVITEGLGGPGYGGRLVTVDAVTAEEARQKLSAALSGDQGRKRLGRNFQAFHLENDRPPSGIDRGVAAATDAGDAHASRAVFDESL
ncbi:MAG: hypothetical protein ACFCVE_10775, partial [Phycisphaerae bacterium]